MKRQRWNQGAILVVLGLLPLGCGDSILGGGGQDYGDFEAHFTFGGTCGRTITRGADVNVFGQSLIIDFYTPDNFEDCNGGYKWSWDGNLDTGMDQFVAGPCLLGWGVHFPPQDILPVENRAFSSVQANADGSYTISGGEVAIRNSELTGYVCTGPLTVEIVP